MADAFIDRVADVGSESEDEELDEETGEPLRRKERRKGANGVDDSSEEEDEDDDEEAARAVREGFIVDDEEEDDDRARRRREKRKRRRAEREEQDERLSEEDLELIGELDRDELRDEQPRFKRLKQGHREDRTAREERGVDDIFSDDDDEAPGREARGLVDEFDDFIEEDEFPDEERERMLEEREVARPGRKFFASGGQPPEGFSEAEFEDMKAAFGDGTEYDWALQVQAEMDEPEREAEIQLKDVFEPSQLIDKMLTAEDEEIRRVDVPERFQIARKPFSRVELSEEEAAKRKEEEAQWVASMMLPKKRLDRQLIEPFKRSVAKVLQFINEDDYEIPFIFQHRKDYLIHATPLQVSPDPSRPDASDTELKAERLLNQSDMWDLFEHDLKFRAMAEKRDALQKTYKSLQAIANVEDPMIEEMLSHVGNMEEVQDVQDYLHFQYSAPLKDVNLIESESNGVQKRARAARTLWEKVRSSKVYNLVRAFGITADNFARNVLDTGPRAYTDDPPELPDDLADSLLDPPEYTTGAQILRAGKAMFAEELVMSPRMRKWLRGKMYELAYFDCYRTEKGARQITEDHKYYEFKYLRHQDITAMARRPELFLRMLKAEQEGLVEIRLKMDSYDRLKRELYKYIESDNYSELADAWNIVRREAVDQAFSKLERIVARGVKEALKGECENALAKACREKFSELKLDQAPYKPKGMEPGTRPRCITLSSGQGISGRDAICWVYVEEDGRCLENGKFSDLRLGNSDKHLPDGKNVQEFVDLVSRRKPDVIGVSGFSVETRKLYKDIQDIIEKFDLRSNEFEADDEDGVGTKARSEKVEVLIVNDEVARLYHTSDRAAIEYPSYPPLTRYCIALAKYMQSPLLEYAALKKDIISISFDPNQDLIPQDKLLRHLESAMVDMVNLVGVNINEAVNNPYLANLLPYVCGLGPRKAAHVLQAIDKNGGEVRTRDELVGDPEKNIIPAVGGKVWTNCASFLFLEFDIDDPDSDYLDNTRVHPEDYEIARKMASDALGLDEEDVKAEVDEGGPGAVVRRLIKENQEDNVNDLILEQYAVQLESQFHQRKRATLETIRAELNSPYEELRHNFSFMSSDEIYTMLTGETRESLLEGMTVPVQVRRVFSDHIEVRLDCGLEGGVSETEYPEGVGGERGIDPRQVYTVHQTAQAKILFINRKQLSAQLSFNEETIRRPFKRDNDHERGEWDEDQESQDKKDAIRAKENVSGRAQRVIKHPLFRPFNAAQAEEYLGSMSRGDVVIRPSSKGLDHLAVTWKVSDNIYQHIDVLELDKDNEFSVGKTLKIGGRYTYSDLDELIVNHVKSMAKKVDEIMQDDKYQNGSKAQTDQWLTTYAEANPKRSMYAFCINPKYPGFFYLCYKAGQHAQLGAWPVKVMPGAFELQKHQYPDMTALKNGFKTLFMNSQRMPEVGGVRRR
ncbi:transcription elongation factor Spt6 [Rhizodiscina lignyota]|uniref:Transcription elongation factor Spt6 n=1 Tax=Rhizodiscina lignyota TaxID=1504668 RepID=A0A9P4I629_9PEZI|nr:transcription elongation factor Spt6 [Rhizodiscina lignyota]